MVWLKISLMLTFLSVCFSYKPIIYMHGIIAGPDEADSLKAFVSKFHPETKVISIDAFNHYESFQPMWKQVDGIKKIVQPILQANPDGVHLICFSQGGLVCRGLLSVLEHNVDTFIALSCPLAGQYGVYKKNFLRLKNLVLVGGPNDGVITPWQSSHFGYYNSNEAITEYKDQTFYKNDFFGLQTLDKEGKVHVHMIPGIKHTHWYSNQTVFECCIKPWLT
ncbi:hypothetical protein KUTeg_022490 [Tegillarca granosa]|uniref:palmitoyl-CoA hydrolase n=1 Tax=Tegillarca granosa TaxID=220873 RepID=A0ABQ9EAY2_TEGGR|nr:hypothetical protein KUTeg_022490 [Tegillarca granosa]